ncbi:MAG: hypothetical protein QM715_14330 [Nibricoccus sp.]
MAAPTGESIATCLRLGKSLGLARQGRLREAQQLLAAEGTLPESSLELHALASLATGDGDYARAQRLWRLLLQREPGHAEAKRMIDAIELWITRPSWMNYLPIFGILASVVLVLGTVAWMMTDTAQPATPAKQPAPRPAQVAPAYTPSAPPPTVNFSSPPRKTEQPGRNRTR